MVLNTRRGVVEYLAELSLLNQAGEKHFFENFCIIGGAHGLVITIDEQILPGFQEISWDQVILPDKTFFHRDICGGCIGIVFEKISRDPHWNFRNHAGFIHVTHAGSQVGLVLNRRSLLFSLFNRFATDGLCPHRKEQDESRKDEGQNPEGALLQRGDNFVFDD